MILLAKRQPPHHVAELRLTEKIIRASTPLLQELCALHVLARPLSTAHPAKCAQAAARAAFICSFLEKFKNPKRLFEIDWSF